MNGLKEVQACIEKFIDEKRNVQEQITRIEEKRTQLAGQRNEKKKIHGNNIEVDELGRQISELGNQSQELQNKLDFRLCEVKAQINLSIDNFIAEGIRKIRIINEEIQELGQKNENYEERKAKYQLQREEFYVRFGRMPELSENAIKENKIQEEKCAKNLSKIQELSTEIETLEAEITSLARTKREFKNGNWNSIIETENTVEEIFVEALEIEPMEEIEEINVEEFDPIEEIYIEEFEPIEEIQVEEFKELEQTKTETITVRDVEEKSTVDEIEELARMIVEEIVAEQTRKLDINEIEENVAEDIITFEEESEKKDKVIIPLFGQKATISNIIVKIEEGQLVYKAQMSDEKEIKIYPSKIGEENVLLRDKQNREECEQILINYATSGYIEFDKKVISKIDPLVCELLIECAEKYSYDAQELIYNYAMSFSYNVESETELVPTIIYNLSYLEQSSLSKKEKTIIKRICKNARKNNKIDIIESFSKFKKIKYIFKRLFAVNNVKVLPEAKY